MRCIIRCTLNPEPNPTQTRKICNYSNTSDISSIVNLVIFLHCTGHQSLTSGMELRKNVLVSGNADSTVKVSSNTQFQVSVQHCMRIYRVGMVQVVHYAHVRQYL